MADTKGQGRVTNVVRMGVPREAVQSVRIVDTDLVVTLKNGKKIVIPDGAIKAMMDPDFRIAFQDADVLAGDVLKSAGPLDVNGISTTTLTNAESSGAAGNRAADAGTMASESGASGALSQASVASSGDAGSATAASQSSTSPVVRSDPQVMPTTAPAVAAATPPAPKGAILSFLDSLPPSLGALGALGVLALGKSSGGSSATTTPTAYDVSGVAVLGPVVSQLKVVAYDKSGNVLYTGQTDASGNYTFRVTSGYSGAVLIVMSDANGSSADYRDEATGAAKSLGSAVIRAVQVVDGVNNATINVTPLTELATRQMGLTSNAASASTATIAAKNAQIAALYGLSNVVTDAITPVIDSNGNATQTSATTSSQLISQTYGKALAALSGLDNATTSKASLSGLDTVQTALQNALTTLGSSPSTSALQATLSANVASSLAAASAPVISFNPSAGSNGVTATYAWMSVGDTVTLYDNGSVVATGTVSVSNVTSQSIVLNDSAWGQGSHTLTVQVTSAATTNAPVSSAAFLVPVGALDSTSYGGSSHTITNVKQNAVYDVTAGTGATVTVTMGGATYTATETVAGSGNYQATITATLADGTYTPVITVTDTAGNTATANGTAYTVKTSTTATGHLDSASDSGASNSDNLTKVSQNAVYDVITSTGSTVVVKVNGVNYTATETVAGSGNYQATITATLADGSYTPAITVTDAAGNTATVNGTAYTVKTALATPTGHLDSASDSGTSSSDNLTNIKQNAMYDVTAATGATVTVTMGGTTYTATETVAGSGQYRATITATLADGTYTPSVTVTDSAGNSKTANGTAYTVKTTLATPTGHLDSASDSGTSSSDGLTNVKQNTVYDVTAETGSTVTVTVNGATYASTETAAGSGQYRAIITATLADGIYTPAITVTDSAGNSKTANGTAFTVKTALAAPTGHLDSASDSGTSNSDNLTSVNQNAVYDVTAESGDTVTVTLNGATYTATETAAGSGQYRATITATLADGSYTPSITVTDTAGNTATANGTAYTVKTSTTATGHLDSASDSGTSNSDNLTKVNQNAVYDVVAATGSTVVVKVNGVNYTATETVAGSGNYQATITAALADGSYTPAITVTDTVGNTATVNGTAYTVKTSTATPTGHLDSASDSGTSNSDNLTKVNQNAVYDVVAATGSTVIVKVNGINYTATETVAGSGNYQATITATLADGSYTPAITVTDAAGNTATANGTAYTVKTSTTATGHLDSTSDSGTSSSDNLTKVNQNAVYDVVAATGSTVVVKVNGVNYTATETVAGSGNYQATITAALADGSYTPAITITDTAGNTATVNGTAYTVKTSTATPTGHLDSASDSGTSNSDNLTNVKQNAVYDVVAATGSTVVVKVNGVNYTATETVAGSGNYQATITATLADGTYTPVITVTDTAGNTATANGTAYTVKTLTTPTGRLDSTSDSGTSSSDNLTKVNQNAVYDVSTSTGSTVVVKVNGVNYTATETVAGSGNYQATITATLADGTYTPVITVTDTAGNLVTTNGTAYTVKTSTTATGRLDSTSDSGASSSDNLTKVNQNAVYDVTTATGSTVVVKVNGVNYTATETVAGSGNYQATITATLADGSYTPAITVTDAAGNTATANGTAYTVMTSAPSLSTTNTALMPVGASNFSSGASSTMVQNVAGSTSGSALFAVAGAATQAVLNDTLSYISQVKVAVTSGTGSFSSTQELFVAGNSGISLSAVLQLSGTVVIGSTTWNYVRDTSNNITFSLPSSNNQGLASTSMASQLLNSLYWHDSAGTTGSYQISYSFTNLVGKTSTYTESYVITSGSPTAATTITALSNDTGTAGDFITVAASQFVNGTYSGTLRSGDQIQVSANGGTTWVTATITGAATWSAAVTLQSGTNTLTTRVIDSLGNLSTATQGSQSYTLDSAPTLTATITAVTDNVGTNKTGVYFAGDYTGTLTNGMSTDDPNAVISGTVSAALSTGQVVNVYDGSTLLGTATVSGTSWTYTPTTALAAGKHSFTAAVANAASGAAGTASAAYAINEASLSAISLTPHTGTVASSSPYRYMMMYVSGGSWYWAISELQAFSSGVNVALGKTVIVGGQGSYSSTASLVDGLLTTGWTEYIGTYSNGWLEVDLGKAYALSSIAALSYSGVSSAVYMFLSATDLQTAANTSLAALQAAAGYGVQVPSGQSAVVTPGNITIDTNPTLSGTLAVPLATGETVQVYDGSTLLGTATVSGTSWSYTPTTALTAGVHTIYAKLMNGSTVEMAQTLQVTITANTTPTQTATITAVTDNVGTSSTGGYAAGDYTGTLTSGMSTNDPNAVISGTISAALSAGQAVNVYDGSMLLGMAAVSGTSWTYTPTTALAAGQHSFTAVVVNPASGAASTASAAYVINEESIGGGIAQSPMGVVSPGAVRYVMLRNDPTTAMYFDLQEFQLMVNGVNVALGKTVTGSGLYSSSYPLSNLVDGNSSSRAITTSTTDNWLQIDLGAYYTLSSITSIVITPTSGVESRINGTYILMSNVSMSMSTLSALLAGASNAVVWGQTSTTTVTTPQTITSTVGASSTSDTNPTLSGTLAAPLATGETVQVYDGSTLLGTATVMGTTWRYTPTTALSLGLHTIYAKLMNGSTVEMAQTLQLTITPNTTPTQTTTITAVTDNVGTSSTGGYTAGDYTGTLTSGMSTNDPNAVISGTISAALSTGQVVNVYDGSTLLGMAAVSGTSWTYTPTTALAAGKHSFTAAVVNAASGATGTASAAYAINEASLSAISLTPHTGTVVSSPAYRYIMVYISGTYGNASIGDLQAFSNGVNVALGKTVIVGGEGSYNSTSYLVDGTTSTGWAGYNTNYVNGWVEVDLGQAYALNSIAILNNFLNSSPISYVFAGATDLQTAANTSLAALQAAAGYGVQITSSTGTTSPTLLTPGYATVDANPTLSGTLAAPLATGETVQVYDGSTLLGTATVMGMTWSYTPTTALSLGSHTISAKLMNGSTVEMAQMLQLTITASTAPTQTATITAVTDNVGSNAYGTSSTGVVTSGKSTDDPRAVISGTISAALSTGQVVNVYDGSTLLGTATVSGTSWTYTPTAALAAGAHSFTAAVANAASGAAGTASAAYVINEETVTLAVTAHTGTNAGSLTSGAITIDPQPTLGITLGTTLATNERVAVYDNGNLLGVATGSGTSYSFTPSLSTGGHALVVQVEDASTGSATTGRAVAVFNLTESAGVTPTQTVAIAGITDAVSLNGSATGTVTTGTSTDDTRPTLAGTVSAALATGQQVAIYDNGSLLGYATLTGSTTWIYQPGTALAAGSHALTATVVDAAANLAGTASAAYTVVEQSVVLTSVSGGGGVVSTAANTWATANGQPTFSGTLGASLASNESLAVFVDQAYLGTATVTGTTWTFTASTALASGSHTLRFEVEGATNLNTAGYGLGRANSVAVGVTVDGSTPTAAATITGLTDNVGPITGAVASGGIADDRNPTVTGTLSNGLLGANQVVQVFDNGSLLGTASVNGLGWSFTPSTALSMGGHSLTAKVVNLVTGAGTATSAAYAFDEQSLSLTAITDHTGPLTGNVLVSSGTTVTDDTGVTLSGTLGHALSGQVVSVYDSGTYLGTATVTGTSWSYTAATLSQGAHSLTAMVETTAGSGLPLLKTSATALTVQGYDPIYSSVSALSVALPGLNQVLDLRQMNTSVQLSEVNVASATNTLKVTASALGNLGITNAYTTASGWSGALVSGDKQLVVDGASGGTVNIDSTGWTQGGAVTHGSTTYTSYTNGTAQLLIDTHLTVQSVL